jgi:hypothetical protein
MSASEAPISTPAVTAYTPQIELDFQLWIHRPEHKNRWRMSPEKARTLVLYCTHLDYKASTSIYVSPNLLSWLNAPEYWAMRWASGVASHGSLLRRVGQYSRSIG